MKLNHATSLIAASLLPLSTLWLRAADAPATSPPPSSPAQEAKAESLKRQQLTTDADQAIADGRRLLLASKFDDAAARFQYALDCLTRGTGGAAAPAYNNAAAGLAAAKAGQADAAAKDAKFAQAAALLQQAIALQPSNPAYPKALEDLKQQQVAYERQVRDPEGTVNNPAVTDEFKDKVATVQKLLFQGDAYFRTGQYDVSEQTYSKILLIDPYNKAARDKMDRVERYKMRAAQFRHQEYETEKLDDVAAHWEESISPDIVVAPAAPNPYPSYSANRAKIQHKLQSIIIDKVNFDKLDIDTVVQFLQAKSKELDVPTHEGINFVLRLSLNTPVTPDNGAAPAAPGAAPVVPGAAPAPAAGTQAIHREVSITLNDVPLSELLNYITNQTNLQFSVEDYAVYLRPSIDEGETLTVRTYLVPPNFFTGPGLRVTLAAPTDQGGTTVDNVTVKVVSELQSRGIRFPEGATATFLPGSSKLVVRNTPEQLDIIQTLIDNLSKETPQVEIEAKIAEFNQTVLKSLSFNYTSELAGFGGFKTNLRTAGTVGESDSGGPGGISLDSIDTLIQSNVAANNGNVAQFPFGFAPGSTTPTTPGVQIQTNSPNVLSVGGIIDGVGYQAVMEAINNTQGVSVMSAPSVTTQNNLKANIDIVQEFPYPTSFDKPTLSNAAVSYISGNGAGAPLQLALPPTPREFVTQDIGVSLEVKPTTYPDQRIDLDISKAQIIDFDGFIDYGENIVELPAGTVNNAPPAEILTEGVINQPVFNLRSVVTTLQVLDGQTAVLGGLIREDTQEINDKVPVFGDIPLIGRLFQSKVSQRIKKNLLIFVTARLIRSNGKPQYVRVMNAENVEETLPEPSPIGPGVNLPPLPEGVPNS